VGAFHPADVSATFDRIGHQPKSGEPEAVGELRAQLMEVLGDEAATARCARRGGMAVPTLPTRPRAPELVDVSFTCPPDGDSSVTRIRRRIANARRPSTAGA